MQFKDLKELINDLPYNENDPIPIQVITEDFIIKKESRDKVSIKNNIFFLHNIGKRKYTSDRFKKVFNSSNRLNKQDYIRTLVYILSICVVWFYFFILNIELISILLTQNFANASITSFLLWLSFISIIGFGYFISINIVKPFFRTYKLPLEFFNPSKVIIEENDLNLFCLFTSQLIYLPIIIPLYIPYTNLVIDLSKLSIFNGFFISGIFISIHYAVIILIRLNLNYKKRKSFLTYTYEFLQKLKMLDASYILINKMIGDVENQKIVSFGLITKVVSFLTILFALIPNIIYTA